MSAEVKVIHMGRAAGKTTELLRKLHEAGGGIFISADGLQALSIAKQHKFEGISIIPIGVGTNVAVDDIDFRTGEVILASNRPVTLDYVKTPQVSTFDVPTTFNG